MGAHQQWASYLLVADLKLNHLRFTPSNEETVDSPQMLTMRTSKAKKTCEDKRRLHATNRTPQEELPTSSGDTRSRRPSSASGSTSTPPSPPLYISARLIPRGRENWETSRSLKMGSETTSTTCITKTGAGSSMRTASLAFVSSRKAYA